MQLFRENPLGLVFCIQPTFSTSSPLFQSYCHGSSCHGCGHGCGSSHFCSGVASMNSYKSLEHYHRSLSDSYRHRAEDIRRHLSI